MRLRFVEMFNDDVIANFLENVQVKEFSTLINTLWSYNKNLVAFFLTFSGYVGNVCTIMIFYSHALIDKKYVVLVSL